MADKLTYQITDALTRLAAEPGGLPLYSSKADAGLFPNTAVAKPAAQKCLADELVRAADGKRFALTEKGWDFLLAAVNPKQVLEDFVRVLEARQGEVGELLATARRMAESLQGLKDAVARVLPTVSAARVQPTPLTSGRGEEELPLPFSPLTSGRGAGGVGLCAPTFTLAPAVVAHLRARTAATDCPLPELFRAVAQNAPLTIGEFHDCLRQLHTDGALSLPAWTGPLYALPEPQFALLIGHGIAYYASLRG